MRLHTPTTVPLEKNPGAHLQECGWAPNHLGIFGVQKNHSLLSENELQIL
jgi:hypothetical protein